MNSSTRGKMGDDETTITIIIGRLPEQSLWGRGPASLVMLDDQIN
ncbi:hypothetical protein [Stieleria mannarensis]|nr:hypothetical protein [Rhodopirellula sp. JC639]